MVILGKTDRATAEEKINLDVIGRVWVGAEKSDNSAGKTLNDKFRIECNDRTREKFIEHYGTDRPDKLNIFLPYATPDECFDTWYESYTAQGFQHRCNGQRIVQKMCQIPYKGLKGEQKYSFERQNVDEPCLKGNEPECATCGKGTGRFFFYVRELYAGGMGATKAWMMSISGAHNLTGLHSQLCALYKQYGALDSSPVPSPWTFGFIPYTLTRVEKKIMRPNQEKGTVNGKTVYNQTGTRSKGSYWALSLSEDPEWLSTLQRFMAFKEVQRLGGSAEAIALIGGDVPMLQGYQESSIWGQTERSIRNATNTRQIAAAIDVVRDEVSQGNLPTAALESAESLGNSFVAVDKPRAKPKKQAIATEEPTVSEADLTFLRTVDNSLNKAESVEQVAKLQEWLRLPKQAKFLASSSAVEAQVMQLVRDRILALGSVKTAVPEVEESAIQPEVLTDFEEDEYPEFDTEDGI
ncbi:hypothetical protein H6F86_21160 [Phormidium sp. FACHB-592]|uniref:Uncharacterized protein n=1 Tax=Stenomitos frigidus AS-A4 TaxID=2933935 RepID=A0ABV0KFC1_9CYAN|nr:hypothetical protein [Phormidium sp. FACHB-592]MBD2076345.1 hypothetical protein [Phormidium sp. FACHB-592]